MMFQFSKITEMTYKVLRIFLVAVGRPVFFLMLMITEMFLPVLFLFNAVVPNSFTEMTYQPVCFLMFKDVPFLIFVT